MLNEFRLKGESTAQRDIQVYPATAQAMGRRDGAGVGAERGAAAGARHGGAWPAGRREPPPRAQLRHPRLKDPRGAGLGPGGNQQRAEDQE
jgi:hypothetical protein